jgi:drug/metabolite transporter (DMT)-like permease
MTATKDRTLMAAGLISVYAFVIGFTDNYVRVIAEEAGLWQFHFTRSCMTAVLLGIGVAIWGFRVKPRSWRAVVARSAIHGSAMVIYFGALAFLDVALVAAGLFTAPIWVLLISRFAYGHAIGPVQVMAVALGFVGVILVLGPEALGGASMAALLPILAGALYALGNIATREWCGAESAQTLLAGFFGALGIIGAVGMVALTLFPLEVPVVQAAGSLIGVGFMIRAYQITDASRASVLEYVILPASAFWTWVIWGKGLEPLAVLGMVLIVAAGTLIALRAKAEEA